MKSGVDKRELREEYGWRIKDKKLVWIVENFFRLEGRDFRELGLYYLVRIDDHQNRTAAGRTRRRMRAADDLAGG